MTSSAPGAAVGQPAPVFALPSLEGGVVDLASYRGRRNVIVWFSRGFTCPYCLNYMSGIAAGYEAVVAADTEVIQVAPNILDSARRFFGGSAAPYPFVCDPDKRLYAVYGLGDHGALEAGRAAVVSFSHAVARGEGGRWVRGAWLDVANRSFVRRLHHHAMTALEQGIFLVDRQGILRHRIVVGPLDTVPGGAALAALSRAHCDGATRPA